MESRRNFNYTSRQTLPGGRSPKMLPLLSPDKRPKVRFLVDDEVLEIGEGSLDFEDIIRKRKQQAQINKNRQARSELNSLQASLDNSSLAMMLKSMKCK